MIVLEGIDGSGKSTIARLLAKKLGKELIHFPTQRFRELHAHLEGSQKLSKEQLFLVFLSDILLHRERLKNAVVDRYVFSTLAYQRGILGLEQTGELLSRLGFPKPDQVVFLDVEPQVALARINRSRSSKSVFENLEELEALRKEYSQMAKKQFYGKWIRIETSKGIQEIVEEIRERV